MLIFEKFCLEIYRENIGKKVTLQYSTKLSFSIIVCFLCTIHTYFLFHILKMCFLNSILVFSKFPEQHKKNNKKIITFYFIFLVFLKNQHYDFNILLLCLVLLYMLYIYKFIEKSVEGKQSAYTSINDNYFNMSLSFSSSNTAQLVISSCIN